MTYREELGGQRGQPITDDMPMPVVRRREHFVKPCCDKCEAGWIVDPETLLPVDRCPCRLTPETTP